MARAVLRRAGDDPGYRDGGWDAPMGLAAACLYGLYRIRSALGLRKPVFAAVLTTGLVWALGSVAITMGWREAVPLPQLGLASLDGRAVPLDVVPTSAGRTGDRGRCRCCNRIGFCRRIDRLRGCAAPRTARSPRKAGPHHRQRFPEPGWPMANAVWGHLEKSHWKHARGGVQMRKGAPESDLEAIFGPR